jgi:hypothetical protein
MAGPLNQTHAKKNYNNIFYDKTSPKVRLQLQVEVRTDLVWQTMAKKGKIGNRFTWHPYNFGKTRKIGLQQFGKPTWQK